MRRGGILLLLVLMTVSCIKNPLSYPRVKADITAFEVQGQKSVTIDPDNMVVSIVLAETADMDSIVVKKYEYSADAVPSYELPEMLDLTQPVKIAYTTYPDQTYEWTIEAVQPIERYVKCDNMVGDAEFDLEKKTVLLHFPEDQELSNIRFTKMKLEAQGSKIDSTYGHTVIDGTEVSVEEAVEFPMTLDCVLSRTFKVNYRHETSLWTLTAVHKIIELEVTSVNAWCYHADIKAAFKGTGNPVIEYRESSAEEWIALNTTVSGTEISAYVDQQPKVRTMWHESLTVMQ